MEGIIHNYLMAEIARPGIERLSGRVQFTWLGLDFKQFSFSHATRDLRNDSPRRFWTTSAFPKCCFPFIVSN
jgi:hypothetical protein